jgi:putative ABC transport system substrate-binding protein
MNKIKYLSISPLRRKLLMAGAAFPALAWSGTTHAQARPPLVIGWLNSSSRASESHGLNAFNEGMAAFGWKHGTQYAVEERWADGRMERLPALALELAAKKPAVIVAAPAPSARRAAEAALAQRWPVVASAPGYVEQGALFNYGPDRIALYQRSAYFVDRILKGTKPADLPVEQPTKFEMVINMKTAKALGITIPQTILVRATRVIE